MPYRDDTGTGGIGARTAELRALRGYSQAELGRRAHISTSQLCRIESGKRYASEQVVAALARALGVGVSVLRGQPYITQMQRDQIDRLIAPIGAALDDWDVAPDDDAPPPRPLEELRAAVMRSCQQRSDSHYVAMAEDLPGLIAEVAHTVALHDRPGRNRESAHWLQAETARLAMIVAYRVGMFDLARLALSRMAWAAALSGDPRQVAVERYERAQMTFEGSRVDLGLRIVRQALRDLDEDRDTDTLAVRGSLYLKGAILEARAGRGDASGEWLKEAEEIARGTGEVSSYGLAFGPTNVRIHRVAAKSDHDEHGQALEAARKVRLPDGFQVSRAGHYWLDRARAEVWTAHHDEALHSLQTAREIAPELTRYHPQTRETVAAMLRARRRAADPLRDYALWCGV